VPWDDPDHFKSIHQRRDRLFYSCQPLLVEVLELPLQSSQELHVILRLAILFREFLHLQVEFNRRWLVVSQKEIQTLLDFIHLLVVLKEYKHACHFSYKLLVKRAQGSRSWAP
jgi:hypothetical protein